MGRRDKVERKPLPGPDNPAELPASSFYDEPPPATYDGARDEKAVGDSGSVGRPVNRPPIPSGNYTAHIDGEGTSGVGGRDAGGKQDGLGKDGAWEDVGGEGTDGLAQHPPEFAHLARASSMNEEQRRAQQDQAYSGQGLLAPPAAASATISTPSARGNSPHNELHFDTPSPVHSQSQSHNPWGDSLPESGIMHAPPEQRDVYTPEPDATPQEPHPSQRLEREQSASSANDAWAFEAVHHPPPPPPAKGVSGPETPMPRPDREIGGEGPGWEDVATPPLPRRSSDRMRADADFPTPLMGRQETVGEENAWVDLANEQENTTRNAGKQPAVPTSAAEQIADEAGWESLAPPGPPPQQQQQATGPQVSGVVTADGEERLIDVPAAKPKLPPRPQEQSTYQGSDLISDWAPAMPPRPSASNSEAGDTARRAEQATGSSGGYFDQSDTGSVVHHTPQGSSGDFGTGSQIQERQQAKNEVYNIKTITLKLPDWPETHLPILTQNANGPCPLLALVNAIIISREGENEVSHYLKGKENISLERLLEALVNELFSGRYEMEGEFVDPGELHEFLRGISTGLNVNPLFVPKEEGNRRESIASENGRGAGQFMETKELKLYGAFKIPLLHGWLPTPDSPAYAAFQRRAKSHEDAQMLLLQQETLEGKLNSDTPLTEEESDTLQDITIISQFLSSNSTQLTSFGLSSLQSSLKRGEVGILFRNDHFSTILRHPDPNRNGLFCLVSDDGYANESNVVFESLTDVDGSGTELFNGSFSRLSGASSPALSHSRSGSGSGSGPGGGGNGDGYGRIDEELDLSEAAVQAIAQTDRQRQEQEDADLAFAMRLEEEENARREREDIAARRAREDRLSADVVRGLQNPGQNTLPIIRPGGGGNTTAYPGVGSGRGRQPSGQGQGPMRSMLDVSGPSIPVRRGSGYQSVSSPNLGTNSLPVPMTSRPADPEAGDEHPPPSYEEAAHEPAYVPTPANESRRASIRNSLSGMGSGGRRVSNMMGGNGVVGGGQRQNSFGGVPLSPTGALATPYGRDPTPAEIERERARRRARGEDDRECVVM